MTLNLSEKKLLLIQQIMEIESEQTLIKIQDLLKENNEMDERLLSTNSNAFEFWDNSEEDIYQDYIKE